MKTPYTKKIIILQGVPASGKSTYAKKLHEENQNYVIVSRDNIRRARGNYWIPEQEDYITDIEVFCVEAALRRNLIPIIDATNLNEKFLSNWKSIADTYGADIEYIKFEIEFEEALNRDKNREYPVGKEVLIRFFKNYFPDKLPKEYQ